MNLGRSQLQCGRFDAEHDDLDTIEHVKRWLSPPDGQKLAAARTRQGGVWRFAFDIGGELSVRTGPTTDLRDAIWTVFLEDDSSSSWMPDERFVSGRATKAS